MIELYSNQAVVWKAKGAVDDTNTPVFAANATIYGRFEYKRRMVRDKMGQTLVSEAIFFTKTAIKPDDIITYDSIDWNVISVSNQTDLDGTVIFYEVTL